MLRIQAALHTPRKRHHGVVFNGEGKLNLYFYPLTGHLEDLGVDGRITLKWI